MENNRLTDEQVLALDKILIEGNERIIALHFGKSYHGRGGSNNSPYVSEVDFDRTLEELDGQPLMEIFGVHVCAIVNDVVYLVEKTSSGKEVISFAANGMFSRSYEVAYDTEEGFVIRPIVKSK